MKLKSLDLHGFKSFPEQTKVEFHDGITAIVGPNGCGKSNIGDAIRWVLGEQRPTAIRGARMEEAIFEGTVARKPSHRASASLVVSNEDGVLPVAFQEVEIGRVVYRDGGSDYRLNRSPCRLRDIVDLCRDTGMGTNAYSVIEIRMVDAILSERTEERRALFEEAAGVGKYKDRRRAALRRLESSEVDLQRVEDVIAEVATKVRSLARQKGKAQRFRDLKQRRLSVEVAVTRADLDELNTRLAEVESALNKETVGQGELAARRSTAETDLESARLWHTEAEKARVEASQALDVVGGELGRVETAVAVAEVRIKGGTDRIAQIAVERESQTEVAARSHRELISLDGRVAQHKEMLEVASSDLIQYQKVSTGARERYSDAREQVRISEEKGSAVARQIAQTEGDLEGTRRQAEEATRRIERLQRQVEEGAGTLQDLRSQGDLFTDRQAEINAQVTAAVQAHEECREDLARLRIELQAAREGERKADPKLSSLEAELSALQQVMESGEGREAVATAARKAHPEIVRGLLAEFVRASGDAGRLVDDMLGRLGSALVVGSQANLDLLASWYESTTQSAGLVLLVLDSVPSARGSLPQGVVAHGDGAPWVEAILGGIQLDAGVDALGAVHLVPDSDEGGHLVRRERLESLRAETVAARTALEEARRNREDAAQAFDACEAKSERLARQMVQAQDAARAAEAESLASSDRWERLDRQQEEIAQQLERDRAMLNRTNQKIEDAEVALTQFGEEETAIARRLDSQRSELTTVEAEWEGEREAESAAKIEAARLENELRRLADRRADVTSAGERATARVAELDAESAKLEEELAVARKTRQDGRTELEELFAAREKARQLLTSRNELLEATSQAVLDAERGARSLRDEERTAIDRGHRLEMEAQEVRNRAGRIRERLEAEWGRPLEVLLEEAEPTEDPPEELRRKLTEIVGRLEKIGPVNMLAVEEHEEEGARLAFLEGQRADLVTARDDLQAAIREVNKTATDLFMISFEAIKKNFQDTFAHLFKGGEANLWLADPNDPLESPIEIHASPVGKKTRRIDLLSGGERALTALSLLFGIYLVKPSPFCVLDEVDAPLDESNIGRFIRLLQGFKADTQFIVITHNPRTIEAADWIYGVTMEEPGVSSMVGVRLEQPALLPD